MSYAVVSKIVTTRQIPAVIVRLLTEDKDYGTMYGHENSFRY